MKIHETVWNQIEACWIEFGESVFSTENKYEDEYRLEDEKSLQVYERWFLFDYFILSMLK